MVQLFFMIFDLPSFVRGNSDQTSKNTNRPEDKGAHLKFLRKKQKFVLGIAGKRDSVLSS